jgi:prepilin-type N-terminal cleavage/methylation domain-containing protein
MEAPMQTRLFSGTRHVPRASGFTLLEVLAATALLGGVLSGIAHLFLLTGRATLASRDMSYASVLASQKLNELATSDLVSMAPTSPDAWMRSTTGHVEYLDSAGGVLSAGGAPPGDALFIRRWSVTPLAGDASGGVLFQVSAGRLHRNPAGGSAEDALPFGVARVVGIHTGLVP